MASQGQVRVTKSLAITKSDATVYDPPLHGLYVGGAGNIALQLKHDSAPVTFTAVPVGTSLRDLEISKVMSTNTTATLLIGFR